MTKHPQWFAFERPTADKLTLPSFENTTYTPVLSAVSGGLVLGTGSVSEGQIFRQGDFVNVRFLFVWGGAGLAAGTGIYEITFPASFTPSEPKMRPGQAMGLVTIEDVSAVVQTSAVCYWEQSTSRVRMRRTTNDVKVDATTPFVWAVGDRLAGNFSYRIVTPS